MKYNKKLLIVGATFINTSGNKCKIIHIDEGYKSCKLEHPSGIYNHKLDQIEDYLNNGNYSDYNSNFKRGKFKDLPKPIRKLAEKTSLELGDGKINGDDKLTSCFTFMDTEEGHGFWHDIHEGNFTPFLEKYPELLEDKSTTKKDELKFKKGDRVKISKDSKYYNISNKNGRGNKNNPVDIIGTVETLNRLSHPVNVRWDNKHSNSYKYEDLELVEEVKKVEFKYHGIDLNNKYLDLRHSCKEQKALIQQYLFSKDIIWSYGKKTLQFLEDKKYPYYVIRNKTIIRSNDISLISKPMEYLSLGKLYATKDFIEFSKKYKEEIKSKSDKFVLPEKWCVVPQTEKNLELIKDWAPHFRRRNYVITSLNNTYTSDRTYHTHIDQALNKGYTQITFDEFKKYVLNMKKEKDWEWDIGMGAEIKQEGRRSASYNPCGETPFPLPLELDDSHNEEELLLLL